MDPRFKMNMGSSHRVVLLDLQVSDQGVWCKRVEGAGQVSVLLIHELQMVLVPYPPDFFE